jgi:hypothetical protein
MASQEQAAQARKRTAAIMEAAGIVLTPAEKANIEIADFNLG